MTTIADTGARPSDARPSADPPRSRELLAYLAAGTALGVILVQSQVISWYRIQEMFRFQSFHMYGVLGSAWLTAFIGLRVLRRTGARAATGERIALPPKMFERGHRYWIGGLIFGIGWAFSGACPGPLFALIGSAGSIFALTAIAALVGTWTYGLLRPRLPH